jgi:hypothetical protein
MAEFLVMMLIFELLIQMELHLSKMEFLVEIIFIIQLLNVITILIINLLNLLVVCSVIPFYF